MTEGETPVDLLVPFREIEIFYKKVSEGGQLSQKEIEIISKLRRHMEDHITLPNKNVITAEDIDKLARTGSEIVLTVLNTIENCTVADAPDVMKAIREDMYQSNPELRPKEEKPAKAS